VFLSTLLINTGNDPNEPVWNISRRWVRNLYRVHQRLAMAFPSKLRKEKEDPHFLKPFQPEDFAQNHLHVPRSPDTGFLFRIDPQPGGRVVIIVQSAIDPDWDYAFHNADYLLAAPVHVKPYNPRFNQGDRLHFRLLANPTRRLSSRSLGPDGKPVKKGVGKRVPVPSNEDELLNWLQRRAENGGFTLHRDSVSFRTGYLYFKKPHQQKGQRLFAVRYEGILEVTNPETFINLIAKGIGPAKGFGFGLLSVGDGR